MGAKVFEYADYRFKTALSEGTLEQTLANASIP